MNIGFWENIKTNRPKLTVADLFANPTHKMQFFLDAVALANQHLTVLSVTDHDARLRFISSTCATLSHLPLPLVNLDRHLDIKGIGNIPNNGTAELAAHIASLKRIPAIECTKIVSVTADDMNAAFEAMPLPLPPLVVPKIVVVPESSASTAPMYPIDEEALFAPQTQKHLDIVFSIVAAESKKEPVVLQHLQSEFKAKCGRSIIDALGGAWVTAIKADPRMHCDGRVIMTVAKIRNTPEATKVARYNINALLHAGVPQIVVGQIYHFSHVCMPCKKSCVECECNLCHHFDHGVSSEKYYMRKLLKNRKLTGDINAVRRRRQVMAKLRRLALSAPDVLSDITHWLGICCDGAVCSFCNN